MPIQSVNIHEAKTHLSRLLGLVEQGQEILICRAGKPLARLAPLEKEPLEPRTPGGLEGRIWVADDFDETPEEIMDLFEGGKN